MITISHAVPENAEGITTVLYKTWLDTYPNKELGITKEDIEKSYTDSLTPESIQALSNKIANLPENQQRLVAKYNNAVVGVATIIKHSDHYQLRTLYVLPEFQGQGIGTMLWNEIKKFCDPAKDIVVQVASYNQKAIHFYERQGFIDTGKRSTGESERMKRNSLVIPEMEMILKSHS